MRKTPRALPCPGKVVARMHRVKPLNTYPRTPGLIRARRKEADDQFMRLLTTRPMKAGVLKSAVLLLQQNCEAAGRDQTAALRVSATLDARKVPEVAEVNLAIAGGDRRCAIAPFGFLPARHPSLRGVTVDELLQRGAIRLTSAWKAAVPRVFRGLSKEDSAAHLGCTREASRSPEPELPHDRGGDR